MSLISHCIAIASFPPFPPQGLNQLRLDIKWGPRSFDCPRALFFLPGSDKAQRGPDGEMPTVDRTGIEPNGHPAMWISLRGPWLVSDQWVGSHWARHRSTFMIWWSERRRDESRGAKQQ